MDTISTPHYLCISGLLKARPVTEGARRFLFMEASNEATDLQGEKVLAKSLANSADYFLRYGNIDLYHRTLMPARPGENPYLWEIGQPVEAQIDGDRTFVKAELYSGDSPSAANANMVWDSLTAISPPARWYPSVGGQILERIADVDPLTKAKINLITRVRWNSVGLSRTPVNNAVPSVATVPIGVLTKCCSPAGLDLAKALAAGYGTDSAALTGGAALRQQSLEPQVQALLPYGHWRDLLAKKLRPEVLASDLAREHNLSLDEARAHVRRFVHDLHTARHGATPA